MEEFQLSESYIQLNNLLKIEGLVATGGEAKICIQNEEVLVNGKVETQIRKKLIAGDVVDFQGQQVKIVGQ